jgi:hypothetical protein
VAATEGTGLRRLGAIGSAALALPGVTPTVAVAEEAPEQGVFSLKYLVYDETQTVRTRYPFYNGSEPGRADRVRVLSPAAHVLAPLGRRWSLEAGAVLDDVSGASPRYYSDLSGASHMSDQRTAYDAKITRHFNRGALAVGAMQSDENDFLSRAVSVEARWSSADNNTTVNLGLGSTRDLIRPTKGGVLGVASESRRSSEGVFGFTLAVSPNDLLQLTAAFSQGKGYFSDPYKLSDRRPRERDTQTLTLRWNRFFEPVEGTLRSSLRQHADSFGLRATTLEAQWVQPLNGGFTLSPSLRYYTQSSADFYLDPVSDLAVYPGAATNEGFNSADTRLAAFGAFTLGLKLEWRWRDWSFDIKLDRYEQRAEWRSGGPGSPGIDPIQATLVQLGTSVRF